eukprot:Seg1724.11 transcript_id=Seg1724.11/GoldUCD/mRNA.D3Y31 product="Zinc finger protein 782" protein_id=Seg1724.11/GoldUCD/D3Y31
MPRVPKKKARDTSQMAMKRQTREKTIPGIEESFLGIISSKNKVTRKTTPERGNKQKSKGVEEAENIAKVSASLRIKKRATSDSVLVGGQQEDNSIYNSSNLKIEAFDFFHTMLNHCCGSQVFNVFGAASILKQFTPEVMKTVIYVIAENSKKLQSNPEAESQQQTSEKGTNVDFPDMEIDDITTHARQKRKRGKWQPVPELVQPRLTSPVSNSCSPVSAAVQALMSFARPEGLGKNQVDDDVDNKSRGTNEESQETDEGAQGKEKEDDEAGLTTFGNVSLASVTSSPFLQPMSSSLMLHAEVTKPQQSSEVLTVRSEREKPEFPSPLPALSFPRPASPSFPWIKLPSKQEQLERTEASKVSDRNLPSISSIFAPIGSSYSELGFQTMPPILSMSTISSSSAHVQQVQLQTSRLKQSFSPIGVIVPSKSISSNIQPQNLQGAIIPGSPKHTTAKKSARMRPSASTISPTTSSAASSDTNMQISATGMFRKILPKPNDSRDDYKSPVTDQRLGIVDHRSTDQRLLLPDLDGKRNSIKAEFPFERSETITKFGESSMKESTGLNVLTSSFTATSMIVNETSPPNSSFIRPESQLKPSDMQFTSNTKSEPTLDVSSHSESSHDDLSDIGPEYLSQPLARVISNIREQGFNIKGVPPEKIHPSNKGKKANSSNSGKLEVASALLSMGSTDTEGTKSGQVVSSFNREKATFDIKKGSDAQHGDILFTKTGTFQIEDIEIDPKKNKIEKDSYECGKCGRVFTSLVYLARHIKRVCPDMSTRKWRCDRCDKAFRHPFGLQQHVYTHTGQRPFKCDQCSKAFYSANDLRRHARTHSGERPYSCSHCNKCFSTTISLKTHTYIHTGERPHKCPHCPKTFATSSKLSRHVVTHSDKRPFACNVCVKTFNRSGDLRRHYNNVHNQEHDLLSCNQCNKLFATQKCLQNHQGTHNRYDRVRTDSVSLSEAGDITKLSE